MSPYARFFGGLLVILSVFLFSPLCPVASAQDETGATTVKAPLVKLTRSEVGHFDTALTALSKKTKATFICEGQPLHGDLTEADANKLATRLNQEGITVEASVEAVADTFDYAVIRHTASLYLLQKRFSDPKDLPTVGFEETIESLENIYRSSSPFYSGTSKTLLLRQIAESLSPNERKRFAEGVSVHELPLPQQASTIQFLFSLHFDRIENLDNILQRLKTCRSSKTIFTKRKFYGAEMPLYEGQFALYGVRSEVVLSSWVITQSGGSTHFEGSDTATLIDNHIVSTTPDPTIPLPETDFAPTVSTLSHSVAEIVDRLNERKAKGVKYVVTPSIAAKPVVLVGDEYSPPEEVLTGVADVYGLYVRSAVDGGRTLSLPAPHTVNRVEDINTEILRLLPNSFVRYVGFNKFKKRQVVDLYVESVRELRQIVEPAIDARPDKIFPMTEASDRAHDLVALSSLATCVSDIQKLLQKAPPYVVHADQTTVKMTVGTKESPNAVGFVFTYKMPNGKTSGIAGSITYPSLSAR